ncbi:MAG: anaerobic ribonucleoside-triphosphate reductase activating protein [Planctomycetes bacterium]|nr:anaerobic ribonucleoside-triphosphate reductase activating protein [Planctomycetota bacterium]
MPVTIKGFIETSLIEWEGMLASILFLPGCNFRCSYCHSPHLVYSSEDMETIPLEAIMESLRKRRGWIDGVVISGGEPTLQKGLKGLIGQLKALGLKVKLDTNGSNPSVLAELLEEGLLDCIAMDVKAPLREEEYGKAAGGPCDVEALRRSIRIILQSGIEHEFRTTVCPGLLAEDGIGEIARDVRGTKRYVLQSFRPNNCLDPDMLEVKPYPAETLKKFREIVQDHLGHCSIRGEPSP